MDVIPSAGVEEYTCNTLNKNYNSANMTPQRKSTTGKRAS